MVTTWTFKVSAAFLEVTDSKSCKALSSCKYLWQGPGGRRVNGDVITHNEKIERDRGSAVEGIS